MSPPLKWTKVKWTKVPPNWKDPIHSCRFLLTLLLRQLHLRIRWGICITSAHVLLLLSVSERVMAASCRLSVQQNCGVGRRVARRWQQSEVAGVVGGKSVGEGRSFHRTNPGTNPKAQGGNLSTESSRYIRQFRFSPVPFRFVVVWSMFVSLELESNRFY